MCRVLKVHRSGFYAWQRCPESQRAREDHRLLGLIRTAYDASCGVYGSPRIHCDLREWGERCSEKRVARLMRGAKIRAVRGYKRPHYRAGKPAVIAPNRLERRFTVERPDAAWVTDITYLRTYEGWLYLAVILDLYSRRVVGWSMQPTLERRIVVDALLMAVWRRRPKSEVLIHSDQGSQFTSPRFTGRLEGQGIRISMDGRGRALDNIFIERLWRSVKYEDLYIKSYDTVPHLDRGLSDYFLFYNQDRPHQGLNNQVPADLYLKKEMPIDNKNAIYLKFAQNWS